MNQRELLRYSRHFLLPEIGPSGQEKLRAAKVLVVGAGGLGSPLALYLAAAGVGRIGIVDFDVVDESNLQRQVLYRTSEIGLSKAKQAAQRLTELNPEIEVVAHETRLDSSNAFELFSKYDFVADGADNFQTRFLANDASYFAKKPLVAASILGFEGQLSVFNLDGGPCYRCLYPEAPPEGLVPSCGENGVLGVLPGVMGTLQATEVIKLVVGIGEPLSNHLLFYDALSTRFERMKIAKSPECPLCGPKATIRSLETKPSSCEYVPTAFVIDASELRSKISSKDDFTLVDVREDHEVALGSIEGMKHIPLATLKDRLDEIDRTKSLVVYCNSGGRSARAANLLNENGFKARSLAGGFKAWKASR